MALILVKCALALGAQGSQAQYELSTTGSIGVWISNATPKPEPNQVHRSSVQRSSPPKNRIMMDPYYYLLPNPLCCRQVVKPLPTPAVTLALPPPPSPSSFP